MVLIFHLQHLLQSSTSASALLVHLNSRISRRYTHSTTLSAICNHVTMPVQENTNSKPSASQNSALPETIHLSDHPSDHRLGFFRYHAGLFMEFIQHPSRIPGDDVLSKLYALGVLPVLVSSVTLLGSVLKIKNILFKPEKKALTSRWEYGKSLV